MVMVMVVLTAVDVESGFMNDLNAMIVRKCVMIRKQNNLPSTDVHAKAKKKDNNNKNNIEEKLVRSRPIADHRKQQKESEREL